MQNRASLLARTGTALLFLGAGLVFLLTMTRSAGPSVPLPAFVYRHRDLWLVIGGGLVAAGMLCLRRSSAGPAEPKSPFERVVLYTREQCHLCDDAKAVLNKYRSELPGIEEVDIDDDPDLVAEFGDWVPVIEIDGKVRFKGRVDEMLFRRLLDGTAKAKKSAQRLEDSTDQ